MPKLNANFILERLEVIGASAGEKEIGNETAERISSYLLSHREGNEEEIKKALLIWKSEGEGFKHWLAEYLLESLQNEDGA